MPSLFPVIALIGSAAVWGVTWLPLQFFHERGIDSIGLLVVSYGAVSLVLLPGLLRERRSWRGEGRYLVWMFILGGWANLTFALAMIHGEVVRAMMLFYLAPVWGVLGGRIFLAEHIDRRRAAGLVLAVLGAFLVLGGWRAFTSAPALIDLLALSAGFAFAMNNVTCRAAYHVPLLSKTAAMFIGCLLMAGLTLAFGIAGELPVAPADWGWLALFGLAWLLGATMATQWAVTKLEAGRASILLITELLAAVVSAMLIGGETLSIAEAIGGLLILSATVIEALREGEEGRLADEPVPTLAAKQSAMPQPEARYQSAHTRNG